MKKIEIEQLQITDFDYILPDEKIAKYPLEKRDSSKLLLYAGGNISSSVFSLLPEYIPSNSLMIFNNTRVIHARLLFRKDTGAQIEVFCLSPAEPSDYALNFQQRGNCSWHCMIGNAKRWKDGALQLKIVHEKGIITLSAQKKEVNENDVTVEFSWDDPSITFSELLEIAGKLPIPPYLNRPAETNDNETYQTVYSRIEGSVAAPTAGLHFTNEVMDALHRKGIQTDEVTLHVGAGTFKPVKSQIIRSHEMHTECISVSRKTIADLYENVNPLIVVGTTSMRTMESLYYMGRKLQFNPDLKPHELAVLQWEPYEEENERVSPKQALENLLDYLDRQQADHLISSTQIIIAPGYKFHFVDGLITNFHQPQSTLLLLIAAFVGNDWRNIYEYALTHDFRFLSYGDSSLLFSPDFNLKNG
ncbi:S-adenosylmethionine:tRNA ribosyltransferase-isomerase [Anaerorudis cellulosivorans]|uniref:S-adenosylmethionine:tRNA ribosyltransferase-isomerase n=1 Tax=Anaerorudis cellulosivorans TaxID=3397862 RepID=UPI00222051D3|nr:S-adenosylmethionine:tRNA ribosyltransferase-isomerase [Seramator thermalis]MCW1736033.1 S-adenosylmethionine:tRNA ribosyltransferase-isomerase [Seramator thermalis]